MDAFTYLSAKFAGYIPADRDSVVSSLVELGLRYEERASGSGWVRSNSMGEMSAGTALPAARMVILSFKPAKVSPIPASVLSVLQGKAGWILIGMPSPGEMSLVFDQDDLFGNRENSWTSIRDEMYVRIQDGAWYETDRTISWKGSRP